MTTYSLRPIPLELIVFARIPKGERRGFEPQYRLLIRGVPRDFGAGYTDVVVIKTNAGWQLVDRFDYRRLSTYYPTRNDAARHLCLYAEFIPENVREYLQGRDDG